MNTKTLWSSSSPGLSYEHELLERKLFLKQMRRDVCSNPFVRKRVEGTHSSECMDSGPSRRVTLWACATEAQTDQQGDLSCGNQQQQGMDRSAKKLQYLMIRSLVNSSLQRLILSLSLCFCGQPINCAPLVMESHSTKWQVHSEGGDLSYTSKTIICLLSPVTPHHRFLAQSSWALSSQHHSFWMVLYTNAQLLQQFNLQMLTEYLGAF